MSDITISKVVNAKGHPVEVTTVYEFTVVVSVDSGSSDVIASINWEEV